MKNSSSQQQLGERSEKLEREKQHCRHEGQCRKRARDAHCRMEQKLCTAQERLKVEQAYGHSAEQISMCSHGHVHSAAVDVAQSAEGEPPLEHGSG